MNKNETSYVRIIGWGVRTRQGTYSLWLGPDHLVNVCRHAYVEDYQRFYFEDIEVMILRSTTTYVTQIIVLSVFLLVSICIFLLKTDAAIVLGSILSAAFALILMIHLWRGSSCTCHLRTAVQTQKLPSITRYRQAEKLLKILNEKCASLPQ